MRANILFFQGMFNFFVDSFELAVALTAADNKIISKAAYFSDIKQNYICGQFITGRFYGFSGYFQRFQSLGLQYFQYIASMLIIP